MVQGEKYSELLARAVARPETLSTASAARISKPDLAIVNEVLDFHADMTDAQLIARQRMKRTGTYDKPRAISADRWVHILRAAKAGTLKVSQLPIRELLAIDNDPDLNKEFEEALEEGWANG